MPGSHNRHNRQQWAIGAANMSRMTQEEHAQVLSYLRTADRYDYGPEVRCF